MSVNSDIIAALGGLSFPVVPTPYEGTETEYITFDYFSNPDGFADDAPEQERYGIYVRYYAPLGKNTLATVTAIKTGLRQAGFSHPSDRNLTDNSGQYWLFETERLYGTD